MVPDVTPAGTMAPIIELFVTAKPAAATPLKVTEEALVKLLPLIRTIVPEPPPAGVKLVIVGGR